MVVVGKKEITKNGYCLHEFCGVVIVLVYDCWLTIYFMVGILLTIYFMVCDFTSFLLHG